VSLVKRSIEKPRRKGGWVEGENCNDEEPTKSASDELEKDGARPCWTAFWIHCCWTIAAELAVSLLGEVKPCQFQKGVFLKSLLENASMSG